METDRNRDPTQGGIHVRAHTEDFRPDAERLAVGGSARAARLSAGVRPDAHGADARAPVPRGGFAAASPENLVLGVRQLALFPHRCESRRAAAVRPERDCDADLWSPLLLAGGRERPAVLDRHGTRRSATVRV